MLHSLTAGEVAIVKPLVQKLVVMKDEIIGGQIIAIFMKRHVQPLQHRVNPMWRYTGLEDSMWCSPVDISGDDLLFRIQQVTKCTSIGVASSIRPYEATIPLPEVTRLKLCQFLLNFEWRMMFCLVIFCL